MKQIGACHYLTVSEVRELYRFPTDKAAHEWLRRRKHLIQPLRAGRLLYATEDLEKVMRRPAKVR